MSEENVTKARSEGVGERYLCFSLGEEEFAIPLLTVKEVIAVPEVTPIPFTPSYFLGIMNLRGQVLSIMDLRQKFKIKPAQNEETAVIICDLHGVVLGVVVDSIKTVLNAKDAEVAPPPDMQKNKALEFVKGVYRKDHRLILLMDLALALNMEDFQAISKSTAAKAA